MDTSELDREYDGLKDMCIYVEHCDGTSASILNVKRKDSERGLFCYYINHNAHEVKQGEITLAPFECKIVSL